jgi:hypothetical protein
MQRADNLGTHAACAAGHQGPLAIKAALRARRRAVLVVHAVEALPLWGARPSRGSRVRLHE